MDKEWQTRNLPAVGCVIDRSELPARLAEERRAGRRIVFTNGCFDILHAGHARVLADAKALGDCLVVAVNDDASIRRLGKGSDRPIVPEAERVELIAALAVVDYATLFHEDTPLELIRALEPEVLAKGGDWRPDQIVGADLVLERGGRVESLPFHQGLSTTDVVGRIRAGWKAPEDPL